MTEWPMTFCTRTQTLSFSISVSETRMTSPVVLDSRRWRSAAASAAAGCDVTAGADGLEELEMSRLAAAETAALRRSDAPTLSRSDGGPFGKAVLNLPLRRTANGYSTLPGLKLWRIRWLAAVAMRLSTSS